LRTFRETLRTLRLKKYSYNSFSLISLINRYSLFITRQLANSSTHQLANSPARQLFNEHHLLYIQPIDLQQFILEFDVLF